MIRIEKSKMSKKENNIRRIECRPYTLINEMNYKNLYIINLTINFRKPNNFYVNLKVLQKTKYYSLKIEVYFEFI